MANNELKHWKYIDRYKKNGEWIYVYPGEKATKNAFGRTRGGTGGSLEAHKRLNREATNQVAKNTPSRNVPGANDQTSTSGGKQMSKLQQDKAKHMAKAYQQNVKNNGPASNWGKNNFNEVDTMDWHKQQLRNAQTANEHNKSGSSKNTREYQDYQNKIGNDRQTLMTPVKTTQKQIRQGIRKAKIKTLKRDAAKAIERAKKWFEDLFD